MNVLPATPTTQGVVTSQSWGTGPRDISGFPTGDRPQVATRWKAKARTGRATVMFIGDSITAGAVATSSNGWAQQIRSAILASYASAGTGWIPTRDPDLARVTLSGFTTNPNVSIWTRSGSAGDTAAITQTMSSCSVMYYDGDAGHDAEYQVDGGGFAALTTIDTTGSNTHKLAEIPIGTLGSHTVTVRAAGSGLYLDGFVIYSLPATTPSVCVSMNGTSGVSVSDEITSSDMEGIAGAVRLMAPDLVVLALGLNDHQFGRRMDRYERGLRYFVQTALAAGSEVLMMLPLCPDVSGVPYKYTERVEVARKVAADHQVLFVDANRVYGNASQPALMGDNLHPNNAGHAFLYRAMRPAVI